MAELLQLRDVHGWYGESHILHGIEFAVAAGELVTLLGRNGAGKTTTLRAIMGMVGQRRGSVCFDGNELIGLPSARNFPWSSTMMRSARWNTTRMSCSISTIVKLLSRCRRRIS